MLDRVAGHGDLVGLVYCNGSDLVTLYEEPGKLDASALAGAPAPVDPQNWSFQDNLTWNVTAATPPAG